MKKASLFTLAGLLIVGITVGASLLSGWVLMLILGGLHHSVWPVVPALGYWPSVLIALAIRVIGGLFRGNE